MSVLSVIKNKFTLYLSIALFINFKKLSAISASLIFLIICKEYLKIKYFFIIRFLGISYAIKSFLSYIDNSEINSIIINKLFLSIIFSRYNFNNIAMYFLRRLFLLNLVNNLLSSDKKSIR